jgi:hypothetical protein
VTQNSAAVCEADDIKHKNLEEIYALSKIESTPNLVKVSFIAKEPGIYKMLWSNSHSWFKFKTLNYRILVLKPDRSSSHLNSVDNDGPELVNRSEN